MPFEVIDHTADMGIRVRAPDLPSLFTEAARGMFEQIIDVKRIAASGTRTLAIEGTDETDLLINMLRELLYLFTGKGLLVKNTAIQSLSGTAVTLQIACETYDPERHAIRNEIKAVTYAGGDIRKTSEGLEAIIIFDI
ncbi:MAG: archease [Thermodesulfobacteriota bacterium]